MPSGIHKYKRPVKAFVLAFLLVLFALLVTASLYFYSIASGSVVTPDEERESEQAGGGIHYVRIEPSQPAEGTRTRKENVHVFVVGG
ncbi:MAG: hypothetical protein IJF59_04405, partial [Clostridia bacterium]|nr:hypothetical protein [Clostridia bacterium]